MALWWQVWRNLCLRLTYASQKYAIKPVISRNLSPARRSLLSNEGKVFFGESIPLKGSTLLSLFSVKGWTKITHCSPGYYKFHTQRWLWVWVPHNWRLCYNHGLHCNRLHQKNCLLLKPGTATQQCHNREGRQVCMIIHHHKYFSFYWYPIMKEIMTWN